MSKATEFLKAHESATSSHWREDAQWRRDNDFWLKYARYITLQVLRAMDEQAITQVQLAERLGCSQQYVSNLLKGSSNMTLETIARLEMALNLDILRSALTYVGGYYSGFSNQRQMYLNEPKSPEETVTSGTSESVDGYDHEWTDEEIDELIAAYRRKKRNANDASDAE